MEFSEIAWPTRRIFHRCAAPDGAIILSGTDFDTAVGVAECIRSAVRSKRSRKKQNGEDIRNLILSLGISLYRIGETLNDFVKRADDGLYQTKHLGRDQAVSERDLVAAAA